MDSFISVIETAVMYLRKQLRSPTVLKQAYQFNRQAFILYVLAEADGGDLARSVRLFESRDRLSNYGKAYLAMALGAIDVPGSGVGSSTSSGADSERVKTLLSDLSITSSTDLAALYGVAPNTGTPVTFPAGERSGLLTRSAMVLSGNGLTNPFKRGAWLRGEFLCDPLSQPDSIGQWIDAQEH